MSAPNRLAESDIGGFEWKPPASARHILLAADETALPALAGILEQLAARADPPIVQAFVEVPSPQGRIQLPSWPGLDLRWLPRQGADGNMRPGDMLIEAVRTARLPPGAANARMVLEDIDIDRVVPWDQAQSVDGDFYAWIAAESEAVMALRTFLVKDRGLDRRALNLMGYWRLGKVFD